MADRGRTKDCGQRLQEIRDSAIRWVREYEEIKMDMSKFNQPPKVETDMKAKNFLGKNFKLTIERADTVTYNDGKDNAETKSVIYFAGKSLRLVLNATNNEIICNAYGNDDDGWVGKEISLSTKTYEKEGYDPGWIVAALDVKVDDIPF